MNYPLRNLEKQINAFNVKRWKCYYIFLYLYSAFGLLLLLENVKVNAIFVRAAVECEEQNVLHPQQNGRILVFAINFM